MSDSVHYTSLLINGKDRRSSNNSSFEVRNPLSGRLVGTAAAATSQDCADAVQAAGKAFTEWEHSPFAERRDIFLRAADILASERFRKEITSAIPEETAAVDFMVSFNIYVSIQALRDAAGLIHALKGEAFPSVVPRGHVIVQRRAVGVVLGIAPWNTPIYLTIRAVAVPILCGNTVVLKCSEVSPRSQAIVANIFREAGLPDGVLNFLSMSKDDAPTLVGELIANPLVRKINFCGSDTVGKIIAAQAAKYLKPCIFELGGKNPVIVLDDADIEQASRAIVSSALLYSGQICLATERVIVQRKASETLIPAITTLLKSIKAGDPTKEPNAQLSAVFSEAAAENITQIIQEAQAEGAHIVVGDEKRIGTIVQPHLLTGVKPGMRAWDRESFGPLIVLAVIDSVDEAVDMANASEYSFTSALWTKDVNRALDVAGRVRAGAVNINGPTVHAEPLQPFGGLGGASGYGTFEIGNFTDLRVVVIHPSSQQQYPLVG